MAIYFKVRSDGTREYYIDYRYKGRRLREKAGPSLRVAKDALAKRRGEIAEGKFFPARASSRLPFSKMAGIYWRKYARHLRGNNNDHLLRVVVARFGDKPMGAITVDDCQDFYDDCLEGRKPSTAFRYLSFLQGLFTKAIEWGDFHGESPAHKVVVRDIENMRLRFLSISEAGALLSACLNHEPRIAPVVLCALHTGMRRGEILKLTWEDISFERRQITLLKTKNGDARHIPITSALLQALRQLGPKPRGLVFDIPDHTLRWYYEKALEEAGIEDATFHTLRHTFASHFVMQTGDLYALKQILGHRRIEMTERYAHLAQGHIAHRMEQVAQRLHGQMDLDGVDTRMDTSVALLPLEMPKKTDVGTAFSGIQSE